MTRKEFLQYRNAAFRGAVAGKHKEVVQWLAAEFEMTNEDVNDVKKNNVHAMILSLVKRGSIEVAEWMSTRFDLEWRYPMIDIRRRMKGYSLSTTAKKSTYAAMMAWIDRTY